MSWVAAITVGGGLAANLISGNQQKKAMQGAANAATVDIDALNAKTQAIAKQNAELSAELERQMTPEVPQLRTAANNGILGLLGPNASETASESALMSRLGQPIGNQLQTPLLKAAIAKAKADLELGGNLSRDTQNAVTRHGLATAGMNTGGLGLGRDVVARDLGLTSYGIENQRLQTASQIGQQELGMEGANNDVLFNNNSGFLNQLQLLRAINNDRFGRNLGAAQYAQSIPSPVVGLDPSAIANITTGNQNAAGAAIANRGNVSGQQINSFGNVVGQGLGYSLLNYNQSRAGVGEPTTYDEFIKKNPYSSAALGR